MRSRALSITVATCLLGSGFAFALTGSGESASGLLETVSPALQSLSALTDKSLLAVFTEPMLPPGVTTPDNYAISGEGIGALGAMPSAVTGAGPYTLSWFTGEMRNGQPVTLSVSWLQDVVGNPIGPAHSTATAPGIGAPPVFADFTADPVQAAAGTTVTISFAVSEPLAVHPFVTVNGNQATYSSTGAGSFTYVYRIIATDPLGPAIISVTGADPAGNVGSAAGDTALTVIDHGQILPLHLWPLLVALLLAATLLLARKPRAILALLLLAALLTSSASLAQAPTVSNVIFSQTPHGGTTRVDIFYDLVAPNGPCTITVSLSKDNGADGYIHPVVSVSGDIANVEAGTGRHIAWDIRADYPEETIPQARLRLTADDAFVPPPQIFGWTKTWSGSGGRANAARTAVDAAGNIYVVGDFSGAVDFDPDSATINLHASANNSIDAFLSKLDAGGNLLWVKTWGGADGRDVAYGVDVDGAGNAYVVGPYRYTVDFNPDPSLDDSHTSNFDGENNIYLSKFAPDGTFRWVRTWGPSEVPGMASFGAEAYTVAVSGNFLYVVGDFSGDQTDFNPWGPADVHANHPPASGVILWFDSFLSKFDLNGNLQWAKTWGGEGYDDGPGVAVDGDGNVYVAGMYASQTINFDPAGGPGGLGHPAHDSGSIVDCFLSKFDAGGNFQWVKTWGGQGAEDAMGLVAVDALNNVFVAGRFASQNCDFNPGGIASIHSALNGSMDAFLSKFDSAGNFLWAQTWGGNGYDDTRGLAVDRAGGAYVTGVFSDTVDFNPNAGVDNRSSYVLATKDVYFSKLDAGGNYQWVKTWGGPGDDAGGVYIDATDNAYAYGNFAATVDFDPGSGVDNHTSAGPAGAFLTKFIYLGR